MEKVKIKYLDIDDTFYIENDVVKVKVKESSDNGSNQYSLENMWSTVKKIVMKAKEYDETNRNVQ